MKYAIKRDISQASHKIALLAVLVCCVLASYIVISIKNQIRLENPIELAFTGFSAPLPAGEYWETRTGQWHFDSENNYFYLGAIEKQQGATSSAVQWRYIVCPEGKNLTEKLDVRGKDIGGRSGDKKTYLGNGFGAYLTSFRREVGEYVYLAVLILEPGRAAELEVRSKDSYYAEDIFHALLAEAEFETNGLLNNGRIVTDSAIESSLSRSGREPLERLYLLDSNGLDGFSGIREMRINNVDAAKSIMYAEIGVYDLYRESSFTRTLDGRITWKFAQHGSKSDMKLEILLEVAPDGMLTITNFTKKDEKKLKLGDTFWPEMVDFEMFGAFIESNFDKCVVDMLSKRGEVVPVHLKKTHNKDGTWTIAMDYLNSLDAQLEIRTDHSGRVISRVLGRQSSHKIQMCSREDILARYPGQSKLLQELFE
jgi:hypothetical protein